MKYYAGKHKDNDLDKHHITSGADPGFDQGGGPDRDRPKTAILGPQFCRIFGAGASFLVVGGGAGPPGPPPGSAPAHKLRK